MWRIAAGMALALLMLGPASAKQLPGWVTNQSGCRAWSSVMQPNRSFSWSGACPNGLVNGQGVLQWYDDATPAEPNRETVGFVAKRPQVQAVAHAPQPIARVASNRPVTSFREPGTAT